MWRDIIHGSPTLAFYKETGLVHPPDLDGSEPENIKHPVNPLALDLISVFWRKAAPFAITGFEDILARKAALRRIFSCFDRILDSTSFLPPGNDDFTAFPNFQDNWRRLSRHRKYPREDEDGKYGLFLNPATQSCAVRHIAQMLIELLYFSTPTRVRKAYGGEVYDRITRTYSEDTTQAFVIVVYELYLENSIVFHKIIFDCYEPFGVRIARDEEISCLYETNAGFEGDRRIWWLSKYVEFTESADPATHDSSDWSELDPDSAPWWDI
ncbi:hypothetical protein TWF481_010355 [Arthrobotrys musiformis]|uniref:HNH nuclease domain-containing protein n=1 Tax=Arthrobotrys musiformis TaxID=47236 RepID=A0AAV9W0H8_9PEZI